MKFTQNYVVLMLMSALLFSCNPDKKQVAVSDAPDAMQIPFELISNGDTRIDNYFWMRLTDEQKLAENPDEQTTNVLNYLEKENAYVDAQMKSTDSLQETLYQEMVGRISQNDESVPYMSNGYYYYSRYTEGNEYPIYCRKKGSLTAKEEILLDVNEMAAGRGYYNASALEVSPDNKILAFAEDTLGRRIYTLRFKNLETGAIYDDAIEYVNPGFAWANDNKTVFYTSKNKVSLLSEDIKRHQLGTPEDQDVLVYHENDPSYYIGCYRSKSGAYIIIYNSSTLSSDYQILSTNKPEGDFQQFIPREDVHEYSIEHFGDKFYVLTNWDAINFRLMEVATSNTAKTNWKEVVAHRSDVLINNIEVFKSHLVLEERKEGLLQIRIMDQKSKEDYYLPVDEPAYVQRLTANYDFNTNTLRYVYASMTTPSTVYDFDMKTKTRQFMKQDEVVGGHDPNDYQVERIMVPARDGVMVPMSIVYKKGFKKDGQQPFLIYGYGSYGSTIDPGFNSSLISLLDRGFGYGIAHIRGSQAMGRQWYEDGKMFKKKNTFNDFIDCSKYLIDEQYTNSGKLFAMGGSAGGLLMGAVANMAPELYKGMVAAVPFVDVISTMSDPTIPLTTNEYDEWGNPDNLEEYEYIKTYSPYDNVKAQVYPNMLVTTGLFDSQVQYWEPAKWVAKLRDYKTDDNKLLFKTNMEAGHGGASGRFKRYRERALTYAFMIDLAKQP